MAVAGFRICYSKIWHLDILNMKGPEKWQVREGLSDLPRKQVISPSQERRPLCTQRSTLIRKTTGQERKLNKQA